MLKKSVKKDLIILGVMFGAVICLASTFFFVNNSKAVGTYWVEKNDGEGPYTLKTGSRSEEERLKKQENDLELDGPFVILKTTSEVSVIFSTPALGRSEELNRGDVIPQVKY